MTPDTEVLIFRILLTLGVASMIAVLVLCGLVAWIWSKGEYWEGKSVKGMFRCVVQAWEK